MKLPLEILREKYIPIVEFPDKYNISVATVRRLIDTKKIRYTEFRAPGATKRSMHANPEDVLAALEKEKQYESNSSI